MKVLLSRHVRVFIIHLCTMSRHFMQSYICRLHASLAVTCHLHFWQNAWDLLLATVVTQGVERILKLIRVSIES